MAVSNGGSSHNNTESSSLPPKGYQIICFGVGIFLTVGPGLFYAVKYLGDAAFVGFGVLMLAIAMFGPRIVRRITKYVNGD